VQDRIETLIEKETAGMPIPAGFLAGEVSPEEIVRMLVFWRAFPPATSISAARATPYCCCRRFTTATPNDDLSVANSTGMMKSFFDAFPKLKKVYFIPFPKIHLAFHRPQFLQASEICLGLGATPTTTADYGNGC